MDVYALQFMIVYTVGLHAQATAHLFSDISDSMTLWLYELTRLSS